MRRDAALRRRQASKLATLIGVSAIGIAASIDLSRAYSQAPAGRTSAPARVISGVVPVPYRDAKPVLDALRRELLPEPFRVPVAPTESMWQEWVARHDREIRARVAAGDDESVINLTLFGTTFTREPRVTEEDIADMADGRGTGDLIGRRIEAIAAAMATSLDNERLQFARDVASRHGLDPRTEGGQTALRRWLADGTARIASEYGRQAEIIHDPGTDSSRRSTLYSDRGLATDTTIFPGFGLEQTLDALKSNILLAPGSVRRIAVIGPGLDFTDKRAGYDFYPLQTIQPFAAVDSLYRLGLGAPGAVEVTTLDLSARVNGHLDVARSRARSAEGYVVQLPRASAPFQWTPFVSDYWRRLGDAIGESVPAITTGLPDLETRAFRVRPAVVESIVPMDVNIVLQRLQLPANARFDLVIATNVLIYYDVFEQSLALTNVGAMLKPGGFFLTNTPLPLLPGATVDLLGYTEVGYSNRPEGDRFFWYRRN
jgi:SAM-dependent methyltransferase